EFARATRTLEEAALLDPKRADARGVLCDVAAERAVIAERDHQPERRNDLVDRLAACDEGGLRLQKWNAPAKLSIATVPADARIALDRYQHRDGRLLEVPALPAGPSNQLTVAAGSYVLEVSAPGRVTARL